MRVVMASMSKVGAASLAASRAAFSARRCRSSIGQRSSVFPVLSRSSALALSRRTWRASAAAKPPEDSEDGEDFLRLGPRLLLAVLKKLLPGARLEAIRLMLDRCAVFLIVPGGRSLLRRGANELARAVELVVHSVERPKVGTDEEDVAKPEFAAMSAPAMA